MSLNKEFDVITSRQYPLIKAGQYCYGREKDPNNILYRSICSYRSLYVKRSKLSSNSGQLALDVKFDHLSEI